MLRVYNGQSTVLGPPPLSRQVLVTPKLRALVKCGFSSAATYAFYTFKIRTSADPHFTPGQPSPSFRVTTSRSAIQ